MPRTPQQVATEAMPSELRQGDVISVGGRPMTVRELVSLAGGAKRVVFRTGETLILRSTTRLTVLRTGEGWDDPPS